MQQPEYSIRRSTEFESLIVYLIENEQDRSRLCNDPYDKYFDSRLQLSAEDKVILKRVSLLKLLKGKRAFNEKLVLCSSSGH